MKEEEEEEEDWLRPLHVAAVDIDTGRPNRWKIAPALFYFNVKLFPVESFFFLFLFLHQFRPICIRISKK